MNIQLIFYMIVCLAISLPMVGYVLHIIDKRDRIKNNSGASLYLKSAKRNHRYRVYIFLSRFFLTRGYIEKIRMRYEIIYPGNLRVIADKTVKIVFASWILCILEICLLYLNRPNLNNGIIAALMIFVIHNEIINHQMKKAEILLLEEIAEFISDVRHNYHINRMVDDAIMISMDHLSMEMKIHAMKLYEIVTSNDMKHSVIKYNATTHNKYLKMFLSLCVSVLEFSDKKLNGQFLFTSNLENLKKEINIEILKQKKLKYLFSGVSFVTVAVCVPIDIIKQFGISIMPELDLFYNGRVGIIFVVSTMMITSVIYLLNNSLKDTGTQVTKSYWYLRRLETIRIVKATLDNYTEKHYGRMKKLQNTLRRIGESISPRQLILQRMTVSVLIFLSVLSFLFYIHENNKSNITNKINDSSIPNTVIHVNQVEAGKEAILRYVNLFKDTKELKQEEILQALEKEPVYYPAGQKEQIVLTVMRKVNQYQREYFKWYELLICLCSGVVGYYLPYWFILYRKRIMLMNMEDEMNQFHSIIYMMMYIDHITVKDLLEELELFASVFKRSLQECINDYNSGEIEALERMKQKESYAPFCRLADNLIRCDSMSLEKAFDEIASDRENYHDRRKQENEISVQRRADIAKPLSFIPTVLVMIYLTLPLLLASLNELQEFSNMMKGI